MLIRELSTMNRMNTIGQRIRAAREAVELDQVQLAKRVGTTKSAVSQWESGATKNVRPDNLLRVADVTGVSIRWLITGTGPREDILASAQVRALATLIASLTPEQLAEILPEDNVPPKLTHQKDKKNSA